MPTPLTAARLRIAPRAAALTLIADPGLEGLYATEWTGAEPTIVEAAGELDVRYGTRGRLQAVAPGATSLVLRLNPAVAWTIEIDRGVSGLRADLRDLQISSMEIRGGASDTDVELPRPGGVLVMSIEGGASDVTIRRPADVAVDVAIEGGASRLRVDDEAFDAMAGPIRLSTSPAARQAQDDDRVSVRILGGANRLSVAERA